MRQAINLPRPAAEAEIVLEGEGRRPDAAVRLTWQSRTGAPPRSVRLTLDDRPLALGADGRAALPAYDAESAHLLSAEVRFPDGWWHARMPCSAAVMAARSHSS